MKKTSIMIALLVGLGFAIQPVWAQNKDSYTGNWITQDGDSRVSLFKCGKQKDKLCGKITWLKEPKYPAGDKEAGKPKHDRNNPSDSKKARPIMGMFLVWGFKWDGDKWAGGRIYNPKDGKTYSCYLKLVGPKKLKVRGYVGVSYLGKTVYWTR